MYTIIIQQHLWLKYQSLAPECLSSFQLSCHCHHQRHEHQFDRGRHMSVRACAARTQRNSFKTNGMSAGRTPRGVIRQHDVRDDHHRHRDSCLYKLWQCVLGNNKYRDSMMRNSPQRVNSVSKIDQVSRVMFPAMFVSFQLFYWCWYLVRPSTVGTRILM